MFHSKHAWIEQMEQYIMSLDQGTTSSRCILFDHDSQIFSMEQKEFQQIYPSPGWVEHDPIEILSSQLDVIKKVLDRTHIQANQIRAVGITNQRETTIIWNRHTGIPIHNAIVWQCRRTAPMIEQLKKDQMDSYIQKTTGLIPDAYFSATKIKWILDHVQGARELAQKGDLLFGTVDTWLMWNLSGGSIHATDYSNASRTMLFDIHKLCWDDSLLKYFDIPSSMLPSVHCSGYSYGMIRHEILETSIPICGVAGDQQAALFGQCCFEDGMAKNTYGTGCFLLMNTGTNAILSKNGLITTIAATTSNEIQYALEGSVFIAGAAIQWLRDEMKLIQSAKESEDLSLQVNDSNGMYIVPAFTGLGAPYWNSYARGSIFGLTRGIKKEHFVRATLESLAYQTYDVIKAMELDSNIHLKELKVDGGASMNSFLMQFQSDLLRTKVFRPFVVETTALGAAYLAGLTCGFWENTSSIQTSHTLGISYQPQTKEEDTKNLLKGWHRAVQCALLWSDSNE